MKVIFCLLSCLCLLSCQAPSYLDNQEEMARIDELPIEQIILELETDSIGQILDTLSRTYLKFDAKQNAVFQRYVQYPPVRIESISYFLESNEPFYKEVHLPEYQETSYHNAVVRSDGRTEKALYLSHSREKRDTQFLDFQYLDRANGSIEQLRIISKSIDVEEYIVNNYDTLERLVSSILVLEPDTVHIEERYYRGFHLQKRVEKAIIGHPPLKISYYNNDGKLEEEQSFAGVDQNSDMLMQTQYSYGADGSLQARVEEDLTKKKRRYFKYVTERKPN